MSSFLERIRPALALLAALGLAAGILLRAFGFDQWPVSVWSATTILILISLTAEIAISFARGDVGLDIIAGLSMSAALYFGETLAAAIVALMYAGGQLLENFAERRASREMTALLSRVPRTTMRHRDGGLEEILLDGIAPGDRLLIRRGEVVPVDGALISGVAVLDTSALTGESLPITSHPGEMILSGSTNAGDVFDLEATRLAAESTYAGVTRLADRYAIIFFGVTVGMAAAAWVIAADPIRAVAVLVIATPCPLILAVPVALVAGLSRAAKHGILIKGGKALEGLARVRALVLDKTGTLTHGRARLVDSHLLGDIEQGELLRLAASLDQASSHILAQTIVQEAQARGQRLSVPTGVVEVPGEGLSGRIDGRQVVVGGLQFVARALGSDAIGTGAAYRPGASAVAVAVDGCAAGVMVFADQVRADVEMLFKRLRTLGIERIVLATGDRQDVAHFVAAGLSIDSVRAELTPDQKVLTVLSERKNGPVMMIGDGINDAPALAAADVGVAMGATGAAASAEAADVVLLVDRLDRIVTALEIARRSRSIALQSVLVGIGLSIAGMVAATLGFLPPVQGALLQEIIDVAVISNALRALT
jgi:heavy metal translocating P-type ATPase